VLLTQEFEAVPVGRIRELLLWKPQRHPNTAVPTTDVLLIVFVTMAVLAGAAVMVVTH
jgi:hypothetical protein